MILAFSSLGDAKNILTAVNGLFLAVLDASRHVHINMVNLRTTFETINEIKVALKIQWENPLAVAKKYPEKFAQFVIILQL